MALQKTFLVALFAAIITLAPLPSFAISRSDPGFAPLDATYYTRGDLMRIFNENTWRANDPKTAPYPTLVAWAEQSGYFEYPDTLGMFAPKSAPAAITVSPPSVASAPPFKSNSAIAPKKNSSSDFSTSAITAKAVYVVDVNSETPILAINESTKYSAASITKLMTATVALEKGLNMNSTFALAASDEVGGARINANAGARFSVLDLFYAMLVGSANNAANAISRVGGLSRHEFISAMNAKAKSMGLSNTVFVDPSGIEPENISTAEEMAYLGLRAYENPAIKRATTTAAYRITSTHTIKNTNGLLIDNTNGLYVLGGKTGYLPEVGWNLVVKMRDTKGHRPLLISVMGSGDRQRSFDDAETIARWIWSNYSW